MCKGIHQLHHRNANLDWAGIWRFAAEILHHLFNQRLLHMLQGFESKVFLAAGSGKADPLLVENTESDAATAFS